MKTEKLVRNDSILQKNDIPIDITKKEEDFIRRQTEYSSLKSLCDADEKFLSKNLSTITALSRILNASKAICDSPTATFFRGHSFPKHDKAKRSHYHNINQVMLHFEKAMNNVTIRR